MSDKGQMIRIALMTAVLASSIFLFIDKAGNQKDDVIALAHETQIITITTTTTMSTTTTSSSTTTTATVTETEAFSTTSTSKKQETTSRQQESSTTATTTEAATAGSSETFTETTTTSAANTSKITTEEEKEAETTKGYGPFVLADISDYEIIDPLKDFAAKADPDENISIDSVSRGIVKVHFSGSDEYKVRVEKGEEAYNYDLRGDGGVEVFPLQMGSGSYRVMILRKVSGSRYSVIRSRKFEVDIPDIHLVYLNSVQNIFWLPLMEPIVFSRGTLISNVLNDGKYPREELDIESFKVLWSYIIKNIVYDKEKYSNLSSMSGYIPSITVTYQEKKGICYDYASFMAGVLRSFGVPVKLIAGYCPEYYGDSYHAWNEVFIDGEWILVDVTYDAAFFQAGKQVDHEKDKDLYSASREF
jgi:uncharacterized membrane protein